MNPRGVTRYQRALRLRCPRCGSPGVQRSWFQFKPACPQCELQLDRGESGYQVGSYLVNIVVAELCVVALTVGVLVATWPTPPWEMLRYAAPILAVLAPLLFFPFAKLLFLAFDLGARPEGGETRDERR